MAKGLDNRSRDEDGEIRQKRGDTHMGTLEKEYGVTFGVRADMELQTFRDRFNVTSIKEVLKLAD